MADRRPAIEPVPAIVVVAWTGDEGGLSWPAISTRLDALDLTFRIAAGSFGTSRTRQVAPTWPLARPATASIRYGSPFEVTVLADLQTLIAGAGAGTGVVGMLALLRTVWGLDLELQKRRASLRADIAEQVTRQAVAELETARATGEKSASPRGLAGVEKAVVPSLTFAPVVTHNEATDNGTVEADAGAIQRMLRDQRRPRRLDALLPAVQRLMSVRHAPPDRLEVREVSSEEAERLNLPRWLKP